MSDGDVHDTGTLDFVDLELDPGGASPCFLADSLYQAEH